MEFGILKPVENAGLAFPLYINTKPGEEETGTKLEDMANGFYYIIAKNGVFLVCKNDTYTQVTPAKSFGSTNLLEINEETSVNIPKIDHATFDFIVDLFKAVYKKFSSEVNVLLYYGHTDKKWYVRLPKQDVSGASVNYELTDDDVWYQNGEIVKKVPKGLICFGTCHSHASMGAFFSATDDGDDKSNTGYQIVIGKVNGTNVETKCRLTLPGQTIDKTLGEVVEDVEDTFPEIQVPDIISKTGYSNGTANYHGGAGYGCYAYDDGYGEAYYGSTGTTTTSAKSTKKKGFTLAASEMDVTFILTDGKEVTAECPVTSIIVGGKKKKGTK